LTWWDIKVRYKQPALGAAWIILQSLATMVVFSFASGRVARMPSKRCRVPDLHHHCFDPM
jgi:homopolymeric O-antigen transport system permease protein